MKTQTMFKIWIRFSLSFISIVVIFISLNFLYNTPSIEKEVVASGIIQTKWKDGDRYLVRLERKAPIVVTESVYYKYERGEDITLVRNNPRWEALYQLLYIVSGLGVIVSIAYLIMLFIMLVSFFNVFTNWAFNYSNKMSFDQYLKEREGE